MRKAAGRFDEGRLIHEHQRLQRGLRALPQEGANLAIRRVEGGERRVMSRAPPEDVHAPAIKVLPMILHEHRVGAVPDARRLVRLHTRATDLGVEQTRDRQGIVADVLGIQPQARAARE